MISLQRPNNIAVLLVDGSDIGEVMIKLTEEEAVTETRVIETLVVPTVEEE